MTKEEKELFADAWADLCAQAMRFDEGEYVTIRRETGGTWLIACHDRFGFATAEGDDLLEVLLVAGFCQLPNQ